MATFLIAWYEFKSRSKHSHGYSEGTFKSFITVGFPDICEPTSIPQMSPTTFTIASMFLM